MVNMTKLWGGGVPALVRDCCSIILCRFILLCYILFPSHLFQLCSRSSSPLPGPNSYHFPIFHPSTLRRYLFAPTPPPQLSWARINHPPGRRPHPAPSAARLRFPPLLGVHKEFLMWSCDCRPSYGCPPFTVLDLLPDTCQTQGFSRPRFLSSLCLPPSPTRLLPPMTSLTGGSVPWQSRGVCAVFFCLPSRVHIPLPPCVPRRLLVSYGV